MSSFWKRPWIGYVASLLVATAPAVVLWWALPFRLPREQYALVLAVCVGVAARAWGEGPGVAGALGAFFALGIVSMPRFFNFHPDNTDEWIEVLVFVTSVMFLAVQVGRLRGREVTAVTGQREASTLSRLSSSLVPDAPIDQVADSVVVAVTDLSDATWAAIIRPNDSGTLEARGQSAQEGAATDLAVRDLLAYSWKNGVAVGLPETGGGSDGAQAWPRSVTHSVALDLPFRQSRDDMVLPLQASDGTMEGLLYVGPREDGTAFDEHVAGQLVLVERLAALFLERHRLQEEASRSQATREAESLRASLVSSVSHELKTPLASIGATVSGLLDETEPAPERVRKELESVAEDVARLNASINDLLDLSRLETEEWRSTKDWHDLADVVGSVVASASERDRSRIVLDLPAEPVLANIDFVQIARAVHHLVENALAYSPPQERVIVSVAEHAGRARVTVTDRGPGVSETEHRRIFEKFYRGSAASTVPHGTGLGLSIVAEIVARHSGMVRVEPARKSGARFVLELPGSWAEEPGGHGGKVDSIER